MVGAIALDASFDIAIALDAEFALTEALDAEFNMQIALDGSIDMTEINQNFSMYAGEKKVLTFMDTGSKDLNGATITWRMSTYNDRSNTLLEKTTGDGITISSPAFSVTLDPDDTLSLAEGRYWHEAWVQDAGGDPAMVATGTIYINDALAAAA